MSTATAARVVQVSAALALLLLAALHFVKPELDPSWHFVSEYAIGDYGWMLSVLFLCLALGCVSACVALRPHIRTTGGKIGAAFLLLAAAALVTAAFNDIDPITATPGQLTTRGNIHGLASMIGNPAFGLAAVLISVSLPAMPRGHRPAASYSGPATCRG